jgi:hypothetical protein
MQGGQAAAPNEVRPVVKRWKAAVEDLDASAASPDRHFECAGHAARGTVDLRRKKAMTGRQDAKRSRGGFSAAVPRLACPAVRHGQQAGRGTREVCGLTVPGDFGRPITYLNVNKSLYQDLA